MQNEVESQTVPGLTCLNASLSKILAVRLVVLDVDIWRESVRSGGIIQGQSDIPFYSNYPGLVSAHLYLLSYGLNPDTVERFCDQNNDVWSMVRINFDG